MYNATYARAQKAQGRDGKAEALAADKAEVVFKNAAVVERLAGALAVAKGQQDARRREKARDHQSRDYRDAKAEHRLEQICRDGGHACIEYLRGALLGHLCGRGLERRGYETQRKGVICNDLKRLCAVSSEKRGVVHHVAREILVQSRDDDEDAAAQDRGRYQRGLKEFYRLFEYIRRQQAHEQHRRQIQPAPYTIIPEILHSCHLCPYFCCGNICSHI